MTADLTKAFRRIMWVELQADVEFVQMLDDIAGRMPLAPASWPTEPGPQFSVVRGLGEDVKPQMIRGVPHTIHPTSCHDGGQWAWFRQRPSGAWECIGCACHHLPKGLR